MAAISGRDGSVVWASKTSLDTKVISFTLNLTHTSENTTGFQPPSNAEEFTTIRIVGGSGTFEGHLDDTVALVITEIIGAASTLTLTASSGRTFSGTAVVNGDVSIGVTVDGINTLSIPFNFTGPITVV